MSNKLSTIFGAPVQYPNRRVSAFVGALASDYLGDFDSPGKAMLAAQAAKYGAVHLVYRNGETDSLIVPEG